MVHNTVFNSVHTIKFFLFTIFFSAFTANPSPAQKIEPRDDFSAPLIKCWELKNNTIQSFASDNDSLIISLENGDLIQIDGKNKDQIWNSSIGDRLDTKPYLLNNKLIVISRTSANNESVNKTEENTDKIIFREIDQKTGLTNWITQMNSEKDFKIVNDIKSGRTFIIQKNKITAINFRNRNIDWSIETETNPLKLAANDDTTLSFQGSNKVAIYSKIDGSFIKNAKTEYSGINSLHTTKTSIFIGDKTGKLFETDKRNIKFKKILRTGGKITSISGSDENLLIVSEDNFIYNYSNLLGQVKWKKRLSGRVILEPFMDEKMFAVSTVAEPEIYFFDLEKGTLFNRITLEADSIIKDFQITDSEIYILTNTGIGKYRTSCS